MTGGDLLKYGLLGAAGFLAYRRFVAPAPAIAQAAAIDKTTTATTPASALNVRDMVLAKARDALRDQNVVDFSDELLNWWQWCVFYNKVRGDGACGKIKAEPDDPARRISIDEFWTLSTAGGLSGLCSSPSSCGIGMLPGLEAWREYMYSAGFMPNPWVT